MVLFALLLAAVWGAVLASLLQFTAIGRFLASKRAWIAVAMGVGGDLLIAALVFPLEYVAIAAGIVALSSLGIIARSLVNEWHEVKEAVDGYQGRATRQ
jgi:hypothetical protein